MKIEKSDRKRLFAPVFFIAAALFLLVFMASQRGLAQEQPAPEKELPVVASDKPMGIFVFSSVRFARGELDEYFDEMEGDFFSRENETLTGAMQGLLYYSLANGSDFYAINPLSYKRMNKKAKLEVFLTERNIEPAEKFDKTQLDNYARLLDLKYILAGDLLKMKTWKMEGLEDGCEMEMNFVLYDIDSKEFIRSQKFSVNTKVPADRRALKRKMRRLSGAAAELALSPHGYCFLDIAGQVIDSLQPKEEQAEE